MRFYRVSYQTPEDNHGGYEFFTSRAEAERATRESHDVPEEFGTANVGTEIEEVEVTPNKLGILRALNWYASHPDNG